jgi:hypothetical protein
METYRSQPKSKRTANKECFGPYAPSQDLSFPSHANLTAYELFAFLPNCIRSPEVIYRFVSNGATRHVLWAMMNTARDFQKEWAANSCGTALYKTMSEAGYEGWTVKIHSRWHAAREALWDEHNLDVSGFQTPRELLEMDRLEVNVPFKSLAAGVRSMPEGDDALDLTRMVQYCVQKADERWVYPRDYAKLLDLLDGPASTRPGNFDRALFKRWEDRKPPPPRIWSDEEIRIAKDLWGNKNKKRRADNASSEAPISKRQSREVTTIAEVQHKTRGRTNKSMRFEEIDIDEKQMDAEDEDEESHAEQYSRAPAEYVVPPAGAFAPSTAAVKLAFIAECNVGETKPFSAYAFGGPRHRPPYRMLHDIEQPDQLDISGWAENLRWAFEQRACFWHAVQTEGWNESSAHMEMIAQTRLKQVWASDELLEQLPDTDNEELEFMTVW